MPTTPPIITPLPTPPDPNDRSTFNARAYPWSVAQQTLASEVGAVATNVFNNAQEAVTAANTAIAEAGEASTSAWGAQVARIAAETALDSFDDRYLGQKSSNPTADNDGGALLVGALYFRTTAPIGMKVWTGSAWDDAYANLSSKFDKTGGVISGGISVAGNVLATSGALGYGIGAGGTVVQVTSKSTAVTLNKPSGQITMHNASLAAGATVAFQLANSLLMTTDGLVINCIGGVSSLASYRFSYGVTATGIASIYVTNQTGGSLSEAIVLNFQLVKGATS